MNPSNPSASNNASQQCFPQAPAYVFYQMPMDQMQMGYIPFPAYPGQIPCQYFPMFMPSFPTSFACVPPPCPEPTNDIVNILDLESIPPPKIDLGDCSENEEKDNIKTPINILKLDKPVQRWKRDNDRVMFQFIKEYCKKSGDTMQNILLRTKENSSSQLNFWSVIAHKMNWRGPVSILQQRFVKLHSSTKLSVREVQLLHKLHKKMKKDSSIKWEEVLYYFPGKTVEMLQFGIKQVGYIGPIEIDSDSECFELMHQKVFKIEKSEKCPSQPKETEAEKSVSAAEEESNLIKINVNCLVKDEYSDSDYAVYLD